jgi:hypothetical protein
VAGQPPCPINLPRRALRAPRPGAKAGHVACVILHSYPEHRSRPGDNAAQLTRCRTDQFFNLEQNYNSAICHQQIRAFLQTSIKYLISVSKYSKVTRSDLHHVFISKDIGLCRLGSFPCSAWPCSELRYTIAQTKGICLSEVVREPTLLSERGPLNVPD